MAVTYPLDFTAMKREIEATEKVAIQSQYTTQTIDAALLMLSGSIQHIQQVYNAGVEGRKDEFNVMVTQIQDIGNDLFTRINALNAANDDDLQIVADNLGNLRVLLEGDAGVTVIKSIDAVADEVNARQATLAYPVSITDTTGKATVDITSLGLVSTNDYSVTMAPDATSAFVFTHYAPRKVDKSTVEVVAYDARWTPEKQQAYDGTTTPAKYTVVVHYFRPKIDINLTDTTGATQEVGGA